MKHLFLLACLCLLPIGASAQIRLSNQLYRMTASCANNARQSCNGRSITIDTSSDGKTLYEQDYYSPSYNGGSLLNNSGYAPLNTLVYVGTNNGWYIYAQNPNGNDGMYVYVKTDGSMARVHNNAYDASQYVEYVIVPKNNFLGPTR